MYPNPRLDHQFEERSRWILLLLREGESSLDQIRIMKGIFLLSQEQGHPLSQLYDFEPYLYGPFDSQVYRDLDALHAKGLISIESSVGRRTRYFRLTDDGALRADGYRSTLTQDHKHSLSAVRSRVEQPSFRKLLDGIYDEFPNYAENSVIARSSA